MALRIEDDELIDAFQHGDERVFDLVVAEHRDSLHRHAIRRLRDAAAAEDAVQETFLRAYRSFGRLHVESRIASWLHQIMANVCIDEANRRQRHLQKVERSIDPMITRFVEPGPEERLGLNRPDTTAIEAAINQLPGPYQEALTMRFVDELSYSQMARATGTSEQNARARVSRARTAIRSLLRGVAVLPIIGVFFFRRSGRTAAALDRLGGAETAATATKAATTIAPAAETMTAIVNTANQSIPLLTKAAIGVGAVSMFAMTAAPEPSIVPPAPPIEASVEASADPGSTASSSGGSASSGSSAAGAQAAAPAAPSLATGDGLQSANPASTPGEAGVSAPAPAAPVTPAPAADAPAAPATTVAPVVGLPGQLQVSNLTVTASGPRVDVAGTASLTIGGQTYSGPLTGRLRIDEGASASAPRRFEGSISLNVGVTVLEIRLQGLATPLDAPATPAPAPAPAETPADAGSPAPNDASDGTPSPEPSSDAAAGETETGAATDVAAGEVSAATATRYSWSGSFRVTGQQAVGLLSAGAFSGGFGPGSMTLTLLA